MDEVELLKLSRAMAEVMAKKHDIVLSVSSPFRKSAFTSVTEFFDEVSWLHSNKPTAFIFGISNYSGDEYQGGHWVAFKEFQPHGIQIINNGKKNFIRSTKLRVNGTGRLRIDFQETVMFETKLRDGRPPVFEIGR